MKKTFKILISLICCAVLVGCAIFGVTIYKRNSKKEYNLEDYFNVWSGKPALTTLTESNKPTKPNAFLQAKEDVKITKITGKIWWDKSYYDEDVLQLLGDEFTTDCFVINHTFTIDNVETFEFELTPKSDKKLGDSLENGIFKKNTKYRITLLSTGTCVISDLKIEFKPA